MGAQWIPKYTQPQRDALASANLDRKLPAKTIAALAHAGKLQTGLEPFQVTDKYVYGCARQERERRARLAATIVPEGHLIQRLEATLTHQIRNLERRARKSSKLTTAAQISLSKWQRELTAATRELQTLQRNRPLPEPETPETTKTPTEESIFQRLVRTSTPSPPNEPSDDHAPRDPTQTEDAKN